MKFKDKSLNILIFNCGSSSLKYKIIRMPGGRELLWGEAERVGIKTQESPLISHWLSTGKKRVLEANLTDHKAAFIKVMELIKADCKVNKEIKFDIFAHRYVHPGNFFSKTTKLTKNVLKKLRETLDLAPIHNAISYGLIKLCAEKFPRVPQYLVFDTAFHSTIPKEFYTYGIPAKIAKRYGLKKFGFHGISHKYVMQEACKFLKTTPKEQKIISCHLGTGGSSLCAIEGGRSINNSMGFTPLEGLVMNTRSGDLDLGVVFYIMFKEKFSPAEAEAVLNKKSGILGVSEFSSDLRDILRDASSNKRAKITFDMYVNKVKKYVGFYSLLLKKADILIFTDSLGVGLSLVREEVCKGLDFLGIRLDKSKNNSYSKGIVDISAADSQARVLVVPTDEEAMIARETYKVCK